VDVLGRRWNPALTSITLLGSVLLAWLALSAATTAGASTDQAFVASPGFQVWVGLAAVAVVTFVGTAVAGVRELREDRLRSSSPSPRAYAGWFVVFAVLLVVVLQAAGRSGPRVPVEHWRSITLGLLALGAAAAGPWIVLVWSSHALLGRYRTEIPDLPTPASGPGAVPALDDVLARLLDVRGDLAAAVGRLLVLVLGAVLLSGALHAALVPEQMSEADFPSSAVLVYGAFFTVALSLAVLPLMLSWRRTATALLHHAYPRSVAGTADDAAAKARMLAVLDLEGSLFRPPVALSALAAPLVTSFLAVFIPQIGS